MRAKRTFGAVGLAALLVAASGCGPQMYRVTFEVADVINIPDGGGPNDGQMLDIDILVLDKSDNSKHPGIRNGEVRSKEWFTMRDAHNEKIPGNRIYCLCADKRSATNAKYLGDALSGAKRMGTDKKSYEVDYAGVGGPKIAIYGRFRQDAQGNYRNTDPVIVEPTWKSKGARVRVESNRLSFIATDSGKSK